ncbi:MAG: anaerobic ribonucleoside-triphosphate reductase activating protein [Betaproteobacteria bacterium]|nr:anaerobic ribonucleoside-triphosphate reductase activating protein [Betaproteobacteria bacterium]
MLRIGGMVPYSSVDYPGLLSAVVFCQGCSWSCGYCHNSHLRPAHSAAAVTWTDVHNMLERRRGLLDAVVFSGGEPTLQKDLVAAIRAVRALGFKVGLHTAGTNPGRLRRLLPLLDWVGMDIKAPWDEYDRVTGVAGSGLKALASTRLLLDSGIQCEFRTTVHSSLLNRASLEKIGEWLAARGANNYVLQEYRAEGSAETFPDMEAGYLDDVGAGALASRFPHFDVRLATV